MIREEAYGTPISVRVMKGNAITNKIDLNFINDNLKAELKQYDYYKKIVLLKPIVKGSLASLIQPLIVDTGMNLYDIVNSISDTLMGTYGRSRTELISSDLALCLLKNEIYTVALSASAINNKELRDDINKAYGDIRHLINDINEIL